MPELLFRCPQTHNEISLGINMVADSFKKASFDYRTIACPHCGDTHKWEKKDVYLQKRT